LYETLSTVNVCKLNYTNISDSWCMEV